MKLLKLSSRGVAHHLLLAVIVVGVAIGGTYMIISSFADSYGNPNSKKAICEDAHYNRVWNKNGCSTTCKNANFNFVAGKSGKYFGYCEKKAAAATTSSTPSSAASSAATSKTSSSLVTVGTAKYKVNYSTAVNGEMYLQMYADGTKYGSPVNGLENCGNGTNYTYKSKEYESASNVLFYPTQARANNPSAKSNTYKGFLAAGANSSTDKICVVVGGDYTLPTVTKTTKIACYITEYGMTTDTRAIGSYSGPFTTASNPIYFDYSSFVKKPFVKKALTNVSHTLSCEGTLTYQGTTYYSPTSKKY